MKRILLILASLLLTTFTYAQSDDDVELHDIQAAYEACISFRDAAFTGDTAIIRMSAEKLKVANTCEFSSLSCKDESEESLNGHLVFNVAFADSLAEGKDVFNKADDINKSNTYRGEYNDGKVHSRTCFVKAKRSTKYSFNSTGHQELAVVAEAGGLVTMKIHVTNTSGLNERHDDTKDVSTGRPNRKASFDLPKYPNNIVELEIINCGDKDCSFVVISN